MIPLVLAAVLLHAPAWQAQGADRENQLAEIRRLVNAGEPLKALHQIEVLASRAPAGEDAALALLRGVACYHAGQPAKAVEALSPLVDRLEPDSLDHREAEQVLGLSLFLTGRFADSLPRLEATRKWAPANLELGYALGQAYIHVRRAEDARRQFASMYGVDGESAAAHLLAAQMMIRLQGESQAEVELAAALKKDPRLPHANFLLGQIALFRGRLDEAVAFSERELAVNPGNAMALSQLGDACVRQGRWDAAVAALQKSIWLNPYYSAPYILLGRAYARQDQPAAAEGMLRRAIEFDPNNRTAHYLLAQVLQQTGRVEEAAREFETAGRLKEQR